jgi:Uma2 family endonuclease
MQQRHPEFEDISLSMLLNPLVIVEVLSPSTENDDRSWKFAHYRRMASLVDYVMISQEKPFVEHYTRQDQELWGIRDLEGFTAILRLPSLGCELPLAKIYERVAFPKQSRLPGEQEQL